MKPETGGGLDGLVEFGVVHGFGFGVVDWRWGIVGFK